MHARIEKLAVKVERMHQVTTNSMLRCIVDDKIDHTSVRTATPCRCTTQGCKINQQRRGRGHSVQGQGLKKKSEAKDRLFENRSSRSRRTGMVEVKDRGNDFSKLWSANFS